jgi:hypothetical protein
VLVDQVPEEDHAVVTAGGQNATAAGGPFYAVQGCGMAL